MGLFTESISQYKASWYETARILFRSRNTQRARAERLAEQNRELKLQKERLAKQLRKSEELQEQDQQRIHQQQQEIEELRRQPIKLPSDLPLQHHTYGPKIISLCLNLCKEVGFRPAATALSIVWDWLGIKADIPSFDVIRVWACRVGVAQLQFSIEGDDWIWLVDHSNQIGQEKVLQIIGIRVRDLPSLGETLPLEKMRVLATISGTSWTRDDVRREYKTLAERIGPPKYLLTDGALELRESADVLEIKGKKPIVLRDMKHYAANVFEKSPLVAAYAKNDHLDFQIHYLWDGSRRRYLPDFLIRLTNGTTLILEIKGQDSPQNQAKHAALDQWTQAVNAAGGFGRWHRAVAFAPAEVHDILARYGSA